MVRWFLDDAADRFAVRHVGKRGTKTESLTLADVHQNSLKSYGSYIWLLHITTWYKVPCTASHRRRRFATPLPTLRLPDLLDGVPFSTLGLPDLFLHIVDRVPLPAFGFPY